MRGRLAIAALSALVLVGCGGTAESPPPDKTAPFVGPWTITSGTVTGTNCPLVGMVSFKLDGAVQTIAKGTDSDLAVALLTGCTVKMNVTGTVATLPPTPVQSCMITLPNGLPVMATFMGGSFTVTDKTAAFNFTGTAALGASTCPVTGSGSSIKGAPADGGATGDGAASTSDGP
jgi:hypothetical protein